ncbi:MHYT domain-containing protein [Thermithiobacillus tepidarius DSM 3134]|uniref:MHYT domain-containing protein n=1 Tax=Thermithiobacillus tepidarius TaxID=929 RepID=UPI00040E14CF|nr:MHYT domain-containing protein [Thermithiobacillus tepidarius]
MTHAGMAVHVSYDPTLVMLSIVVAIGASYTALELAGRLAAVQGRLRLIWLLGGAAAMGIGIWSMHFIGMMAMQMPVPMRYDPDLTILSMLIAVGASGVALFTAGRRLMGTAPLLVGGMFMGAGIAAMHYIGMAAMRMPVVISYRPGLFIASILIAVSASVAALWLAFHLRGETLARWSWKKIGSAAGMGVAIAGMHYTGMQAAIFTPLGRSASQALPGMGIDKLGAAALGFASLFVLAIAVISAYKEYLQRERELSKDRLLREAQEFRDRVMHSVTNAIVALDRQGRFTLANRRTAEMTGYAPEELIGQPFSRFFRSDALAGMEAHFAQITSQGSEVRDYETELLCRDGSVRAVSISMAPLRQGGRVVGVVGTAEDISERKRAEAAIRQLNAELEQRVAERTAELTAVNAELMALNRELEAFSYSVSHDLRAPLRAIHGFSQVLLEDYNGKLDSDGQKYLERVLNASQRMGQLIDDLLSLSRITRSEMHREPVNLSMLAHGIAAALQAEQPTRRVNFVIEPEVTAHGDPRLLEILLDNLLGNAWKFTGKRNNARIEFGVREEAGERVYFVRDNGAGFDMAYADKLFGAFQRLHGVTEFEGTGIGLAIVQRVIDRHGGRIWAEGAVEQGAAFYFTLE